MTSIALALSLTLSSVASGQTAAKSSALEQPQTAIAEGIRLLEARQYAAFLAAFVPPNDQPRLGTTPAEKRAFVRNFAQSKVPDLLAMLKGVVAVKPSFNADKTRATFVLTTPVGKKESLTLTKIGKYWYIGDR